jgi:hypothetical protein
LKRTAFIAGLCLFLAGPLRSEITGVITYPDGSSGEVQFEKDGYFAGSSSFTFSSSTYKLTVPKIVVTSIVFTTDGSTQTTASSGSGGGSGGWTDSSGSTQTTTTGRKVGIGTLTPSYILDLKSPLTGGIGQTDYLRLYTDQTNIAVGYIYSASGPWTLSTTGQSGGTTDLTCTMAGGTFVANPGVFGCNGNPGVLAYDWFTGAIYVKNPNAQPSGTRGEVGINNSSPSAQLDIRSRAATGATDYILRVTSQSTSVPMLAVLGSGDIVLNRTTMTFPSSNASGVLTNNGSGSLSWAAASSGSGSNVATATGTSAGFTGTVSTATTALLLNSAQFIAALQGGSTAYYRLDPSSVTLQGLFVSSLAFNSVATNNIVDGTIANADVASAASINLSKLSLGDGVDWSGVPTFETSVSIKGVNYVQDQISVGSGTIIAGTQLGISTAGTTATARWWTSTTGNTNGDGMKLEITPTQGLLWMHEARALGFATSGVERLSILSGGNVGVGATTPQYKLEVATGVIYNGGSTAGITTTGTVTGNAFVGSGGGITNLTAANILAGTLGASVIASSVGINTVTNPNVAAAAGINLSKLSLSDAAAWTGIHSWSSSATFIGPNFSVGTSTLVTLNGNVGIGDTTPDAANGLEIKSGTTGSNFVLAVTSQSDILGMMFGIRADGNMVVNSTTYTWPGSNASGALTNNGSGTLSWSAAGGSADNLGNHVATTSLNMAGFAVYSASGVTLVGAGDGVINSTNSIQIQTGVAAATVTFSTGGVQMGEVTAPGIPPSGTGRLYPKSDHKLYWQSSGGTETDLTAAAGSSGGWTVVNSTSYTTNDVVVGTSASQGIQERIVAQTVGKTALSVETSTGTASTDFVTWRKVQGATTTTSASTASIVSITISTDSAAVVHAHVAALRVGGSAGSGGEAAGYDMRTAVKRSTSGAVTFIGGNGGDGSQDVTTFESTPTWNAYFSTTSTTLEIVAAGLANNNIKWFGDMDYLVVSTNVTAAAGGGSLTFDTSSFNSATSGSEIDVGNLTITANSNRMLLYLISNRRSAAQNVSTITFNALASTYVDDGNGTFIHAEVHDLLNPTSGVVAKASVTYSAALAASGVSVISLYNVNASSAIRSYANTDSDSATSISQTLPTASGDACFALYARSTPTTLTAAAGEGVLVQSDIGTEFTHMVSSRAATSTSTTMSASWTGSNRIRMEMICIKP